MTEASRLLSTAEEIRRSEREQAVAVGAGTTLRQQLHFTDYLEERSRNPGYSFREHLRKIGGAIEE